MYLIPLQKFVALGLPRGALTPSNRLIEAANGARLDVIGWSDCVMSSPTATGGTMSTTQRLYVVRGVNEAYLSCNALRGLGMVNRDRGSRSGLPRVPRRSGGRHWGE